MVFDPAIFQMPSSSNSLSLGVLLGVLVVTTLFDVVRRRIPNFLIVVGLLCAGVIAVTAGWGGLGRMTAGILAALFIFLPVYSSGVMAAGDVKLLSIVGAFLGLHDFLMALLFVFIAGGLLAVVMKLIGRFFYTRPGMPYAVAVLGGVTGYLTILN
jgi:prepilin peptidase CpaA